jgi:hypothetical protein
LARHVEVDLGCPRATDLDRIDDEVRAGERLPAVEVGADLRRGTQRAGRPAGHPLRRREPVGVDIVERDLGVAERRGGQDVAEQVPGELDAAGADEDDPGHGSSASPPPMRRPDIRTSGCQGNRSLRPLRNPGAGLAWRRWPVH